MKLKPWLLYALLTTFFWGIWGAFSDVTEKAGFPATLGYVVWALTMVIPALVMLIKDRWKIDRRKKAVLHGLLIGLFGAAGQLILFQALKRGPAYLVFPLVSLSPLVTIFLSLVLLKERASAKSWTGIVLAVLAIPLLAYQPSDGGQQFGSLWIILALLVFLLWGIQAYFIRVANSHMQVGSIFFYMTLASVSLIPAAVLFTDFSQPINWGFKGPVLATGIQLLNSVGALFLVFAFRYGRAIIVSPLTNTGAPVITVILSLILYNVIPQPLTLIGMLLAIISIFLLAD